MFSRSLALVIITAAGLLAQQANRICFRPRHRRLQRTHARGNHRREEFFDRPRANGEFERLRVLRRYRPARRPVLRHREQAGLQRVRHSGIAGEGTSGHR